MQRSSANEPTHPRKPTRRSIFLSLLLAWCAPLADAQQGPFEHRVGDYTLIYSAVRSDTLPEQTARRHGLPTNANVLLVNLTVQRNGANVRASVDASATNLAQQLRDIEMHETVANDLVSYLGVVEIADREVLDFALDVLPEGADRPIRIEFRESFLPQPGSVEP